MRLRRSGNYDSVESRREKLLWVGRSRNPIRQVRARSARQHALKVAAAVALLQITRAVTPGTDETKRLEWLAHTASNAVRQRPASPATRSILGSHPSARSRSQE